jgi:hypothetical protein
MLESKGPPANTGFWWSFGFDIRFCELGARSVANVKSAPLVALIGGQIMRRPAFSDARRQPASAGSREALNAKDGNERDSLQENGRRIPMPMMLIIGALMGASRD